MADFDDILGHGTRKTTTTPFMDNPFEDVFADVGRPRSPDPWSSGGWDEIAPAAVHPTSTSLVDPHMGFPNSTEPSYSFQHDEPTPSTPGAAAHFEHQYIHKEEPEPPAPTPAEDPLGLALVESDDEKPLKRNPFGPLPPVPRLPDPAPASPPTVKASPESPKKSLEKPAEEASVGQVTPSEEPTPAEPSSIAVSETHSLPPATSAPVDHPLPPTPKDEGIGFQPPAIVETRASPISHQPPHPNISGAASSSSSSFSRDRSESSATTDSLSTAKYDRIVSPLESPATFGSRTPLDHSFSNLALGGEIPGWGPPVVYKPSVNEESTPIERSDSSLSPSQSVATVKEAENGFQESESIPTQHPVIPPEFIITVGDPQKVGDPISAHIVYTVTTRTTSPRFAKSNFSVLRRYSDFLWLYDIMAHNNPGVVIPPVPEKNAYNRFDNTFIESRRMGLNKCVQKIANHPVLSVDNDFKMFLESDSFALDIKHRRIEHSNSGILGTLGSLTAPKFYEIDDWYDNKKAYLDALESQLKGLVKAIDIVTKQRAEFATCIADFAETISALANSDLSKQLSGSLNVLADVEKLYKESQDVQSKDDALTIMATADEYGRLITSVRLAFGSRVKLYFAWQQADNDARRAKSAHEKARRQGRIPTEAMGSSLAALAEADRKAADAKKEFDEVSILIKTELNRFERERIEDFKIAMDQFLEGMIKKQKDLVKAWENYQETLLKKAASNPTSNGAQHQVQTEGEA